MSQKTHSQDSNCNQPSDEEALKAYKDAAEADRFLFGDYDYSYVWLNGESNDIS